MRNLLRFDDVTVKGGVLRTTDYRTGEVATLTGITGYYTIIADDAGVWTVVLPYGIKLQPNFNEGRHPHASVEETRSGAYSEALAALHDALEEIMRAHEGAA